MNTITSFDAIVSAAKRAPVKKFSKTLNGEVYIRHMTAAERDNHEASVITKDGKVDVSKIKGVRQRLLAVTLCNEQGEPITTAERLNGLPAEVIDELAEFAAEVNGLRQKDKEEAGNASEQTAG